MQAIKANVPNAMRQAAIIAANKVHAQHPFAIDLKRSKSGYDTAFEGKGHNASLSHSTYTKIKESCGL